MTDGVAQWQRLLLPAAVLAESDGRRTPRDWVVDALMYAFAVVFGIAILGATTSYRSDLTIGLDIALGVVSLVALWFRRTRPIEVAVVAIALSAFSALAAAAALAACFNASLRMSNGRRVAAVGLFGCVGAAVSAFSYGSAHGYDWSGLFVGLLLTTVAIGWGLFARAQRELVASLHERAARLENEHRLYAEQARDAERRRIAREMYGVLAHRLSLLSVHAGALEFRPDAPAEDIAAAASIVRASAHSALQELREVIGVLREPDLEEPLAASASPDTAPPAATAPAVASLAATAPLAAGAAPPAITASRRGGGADGTRAWAGPGERATDPPQPTFAEIPALVDESRAAGAKVRLRVDVADGAAVPAALGRTAYRIVQEGLTNARKHAPASAVEVVVEGEQGKVVVSVVSRRPVGVVAAPGGDMAMPGSGAGLIGLRERVALAGGELESGPDAAGDFVLRAVLPWEPAA